MNPTEPDELIPTRHSLLERLRRWDDHQGWQEFFDTYWKLIYRAALNAGLAPLEAEEVVQDTIVSVAHEMPGFRYVPREQGGSFKKWLLTLTKWRIADLLRRKQREQAFAPQPSSRGDGSELADAVLAIPDPVSERLDQLWEAEWEHTLLESALERLKLRVDPKHYQIFDLYVLKEWPVGKVAASLNVSRPQVYIIKHRLTKQLKSILNELRCTDCHKA
jgi:RNA polymerase sigma-70 factor (ECF subfamily)